MGFTKQTLEAVHHELEVRVSVVSLLPESTATQCHEVLVSTQLKVTLGYFWGLVTVAWRDSKGLWCVHSQDGCSYLGSRR